MSPAFVKDENEDEEIGSFRVIPPHKPPRRGSHERKLILSHCTTLSFEELSEKDSSCLSPQFAELVRRNQSGIFGSLSRRANSDYVINPSATWKVCWDIFVGVIILYSAIVVPFRLGFHVVMSKAWLLAEVSVDVVFLIDMIFSLFTSYEENGEHVHQLQAIAKNYMKSWFMLDLVSTMPFYLFGNNLKSLKLVRVIRLFRLLKLIRLLRLNHKLANAKTSGHITLAFYELSMVLIVTLFLSHLFSCMFYILSACDGATEADGYSYEQCGSLHNLYSKYLLSLHWTLATVLKVGYGDVLLSTQSGMMYSVAVMAMGSIISGYILAVMLKQAETANPIATEKSIRMNEIGLYLREKEIPRKVMQRLSKHFDYYYSQISSLQEPQDMGTTAPALRLDLFNVMRSDIVKLNMFSQEFLLFSELQRYFHPFLADSGETIVSEGDACAEIFFLIHGCIHGLKYTKQSSVVTETSQSLVGMWSDGGQFGTAAAMMMEDACWASYVSISVSDMVWIDIAGIVLSFDTSLALNNIAKRELDNHTTVNSQLKNVRIDSEGCSVCPLIIYNEKVLSPDHVEKNGLMKRGLSVKSSNKSSNKSVSSVETNQDAVFRVAKLTGAFVDGHREFDVELETTMEMLQRGIINPHWHVKMIWDLFVIICTVAAIITLPLRFGFELKDTLGWITYDIIVEVTFLVDMVLGFFTAYERPDFLLNTEHRFIAINYFKGWFIFDFMAGFPFSLLLTNSQVVLLKLFKVVRIVKVIRILKILKVSRLLKVLKITKGNATKFTSPFSNFENTTLKLVRCISIACLVTHFGACGWGKLDRMRKDGKDWTNEYNAPVGESLYSLYVAAFYWAVATATGTGYGDIVGQNDNERLFNIFFMIGGISTMVYLVGQVAESGKDESRDCGKVGTVRSYLAEQALHESLKTAVLRHFAYAVSTRSEFNEVHLWSRMPFTTRVIVALAAHKHVISKFPKIFKPEEKSLTYILLKYLEPSLVVANAYVYTFETGSAGIYLLLRGEGEIVDETEDMEEIILSNIIDGEVFGLEASHKDAITFVGVRALSDMMMYVLSVSKMTSMKSDHPLCAKKILRLLTNGMGSGDNPHEKAVRRNHHLKRSQGATHKTEDAFTQAVEWILDDGEDQAVEMTKLRCLKSHPTVDETDAINTTLMLEAINKNSPSLSLSFEGRERFLAMKRKLWHKGRDDTRSAEIRKEIVLEGNELENIEYVVRIRSWEEYHIQQVACY